MINRVSVMFSVIALTFSAYATRESATGQQLRRLEHVWNVAHIEGDVKALSTLWSEDIVILVPRMPPLRKADVVAMWRSQPTKFSVYETSDITIREFGRTAIVTGRLRRTREFGGRAASEDWQFTKVYVRSHSTWRVVTFHASESP